MLNSFVSGCNNNSEKDCVSVFIYIQYIHPVTNFLLQYLVNIDNLLVQCTCNMYVTNLVSL